VPAVATAEPLEGRHAQGPRAHDVGVRVHRPGISAHQPRSTRDFPVDYSLVTQNSFGAMTLDGVTASVNSITGTGHVHFHAATNQYPLLLAGLGDVSGVIVSVGFDLVDNSSIGLVIGAGPLTTTEALRGSGVVSTTFRRDVSDNRPDLLLPVSATYVFGPTLQEPTLQLIPEPAFLLLLASGLLAWSLRRRSPA
jgi:hypothetical protein